MHKNIIPLYYKAYPNNGMESLLHSAPFHSIPLYSIPLRSVLYHQSKHSLRGRKETRVWEEKNSTDKMIKNKPKPTKIRLMFSDISNTDRKTPKRINIQRFSNIFFVACLYHVVI
jgi:hypothetical protein